MAILELVSLGSLPSISNTAIYASVISILALVFKSVYDYSTNPLKSVPGPFSASLSRFYWCRVALSGHQEQTHMALHEEYGPIVRVAPHIIMLNDPEYVAQYYKWDRSSYTLPFETQPGVSGVTTQPDMRLHAKQRKKVAAGFSLSAVMQSEDLIDKHILNWIEGLKRVTALGKPVDFSAWAQWLAMDVVMDVVFGSPVGFVAQAKDVNNFIGSLREMFLFVTFLANMPELVRITQLPFIWPFVAPKPTDKSSIGFLMGAGHDAVEKRLREGNVEKRKDVLQQWIEYRDMDDVGMTVQEMKTETLGPIGAGSDTTAVALRAMVLYISTNPRVLAKLLAELESPGRSYPIKYQEAQKMPYLQAVILETLRIYSPIGMPLGRVIPAGGTVIRGYDIPEGSEVMMAQWCMGHNKEIYGEDVEIFRPERWMREDGESEEEAERRIEGWKKIEITFGSGQVTCLGRNIAMMEMTKAISALFLNFDVQIVKPHKPWKVSNLIIFVHEDFMVRLTPRTKA